MQLIRKFYAVDPADGGPQGPSDRDMRNAEDLKETFADIKNQLRSISSILKDDFGKALGDTTGQLRSVGKSIEKDMQGKLKEVQKLQESINNTQKNIGKTLSTEAKVTEAIAANNQRGLNLVELLNEAYAEGVNLNQNTIDALYDALNVMRDQDAALQAQLLKVKAMEKTIGRLGGVMKGFAQIPIIGQFIKAEAVLKKMEETAATGASKMKVFEKGAGAFLGGITTGLTALLMPALTGIYNAVMDFNKGTFEISKNLGTSVEQASVLQNQFLKITTNSANAGLMTKDVAKTYAEMSNSAGFLVSSSAEFAETAALIQKRTGASAEDMNTLARQSALSGKSLQQTYSTIEASRQVEGARNKLSLSTRQIMEGISKVSSTVTINLQGSTKALADGVIRATKLGTTLEQINKQGESLLDFESSIGKEFEAQLLTGRDINLTHARDLAMQGKTSDLMEELSKQQVTYDSFVNQTVFAKKAEADAVGLSIEELSKQLLLQKQSIALGAKEGQSLQDRYNEMVANGATQEEIATTLNDKQVAADLAKASRAEKFEASMDKLKTIIGSMLDGPVGDLIDQFAVFVGDAKKMTYLGETLKGIFSFIGKTIQNFPQILSSAVTVMKVLVSLSIARAVASVVAGSAFAGPAALIAGGLAYSWLSGLVNGGSGSAPTTGGGGGAAEMALPLNPATTAATQATQAATTAAPAPIFKFNVNTNVGTENWSKQSRTAIQEDPGTSLQ
jgi:hypothetical protein